MEPGEFRKDVDRAIAIGDAALAARMLASAWEVEPGSALAGFVVSRYDRIAGRLGLLKQRWAILRSFTVEPLVPILKAGAYAGGVALETHLGEFNAYAQEILDPGSALYRFQPDVAVLAVQTRDVAPALWRGESAADDVLSRFGDWIGRFRKYSTAALIVHSLEVPMAACAGGGASRGLCPGLRRAGGAAWARKMGRCAQVAHGPSAGSVRQPAAPRQRVAALPASPGRQGGQVRGGRPGQHALGWSDRRRRDERHSSGRGVPRRGLPGTTARLARSEAARHPAGGVQQEQSGRRHGGAFRPSGDGTPAARFCRHADQLERESAEPAGDRRRAEYRARHHRIRGRQSGGAEAGPLAGAGGDRDPSAPRPDGLFPSGPRLPLARAPHAERGRPAARRILRGTARARGVGTQRDLERGFLPRAGTGGGDRAGERADPGAGVATDAEDQPVQSDDAALHGAADRRDGRQPRLARVEPAGEGQ